jgi:replicative DNA helicase
MKLDINRLWSKEAEAAVLGSMIIDSEIIPDVLGIITKTDMFFDAAHRTIFDSIIHLYLQNKPTEMVMLRTELQRLKKLDEIGGVEYLSRILDSVPSSANAQYYARIVRNKYNYRTLVTTVEDIQKVLDDPCDVNEQIEMVQSLALGLKEEKETECFTFKDHIAESVVVMADKKTGIKTGYRDVDRIISCIYDYEFVVMAGRPGMGKSALAFNIAVNVAKEGKRVLIFSMEMSAESIMQRSVCAMASVEGNKWRDNPVQAEFDEALRAAERLSQLDITIYESIEHAGKIRSIAAINRRTKPIGLICIDNIQLMQTSPPVQKEYERLTIISRELKQITQTLHIPVLCISHLNREVDKRDNHRPRLSDLRGSGCIQGDSMISCKDGFHTIEDIYKYKLPVLVLSCSTKKKSFCFQKPEKVFNSGKKRCLKITTASGKVLIISRETPICSRYGWSCAEKYKVGDKIYVDTSG